MKKQAGFTLIELMIVVAIIGILAAIAVPQYQTYIKKAKFTEVVNATASLKSAVEMCLQEHTTLECTTGAFGIPADVTTSSGSASNVTGLTTVGSATVTTIQASGKGSVFNTGATTDVTFTIAATKDASGVITWAKGGSCLTLGICG